MEAWQSILVSLVIVCSILAGSYVAYEQGMFDPLIEKFGYASPHRTHFSVQCCIVAVGLKHWGI